VNAVRCILTYHSNDTLEHRSAVHWLLCSNSSVINIRGLLETSRLEHMSVTLVHVYWIGILSSNCKLKTPCSVTDKLQHVLNAAARVITNTKKYESGLSRTVHHDLHWLDVTERIQFRVSAAVYQCLHGMTAAYLTELCTPVAASARRRGGLRSSTTSDLVIPRCRLSTYGSRAFSVAGPVCWNALPDYLKSPDISFDCFRQQLKTFLFCRYWQLLALL